MTAKAVTAISKNRLVFISFSLPCGAYLGAIIPRLRLLRKRMWPFPRQILKSDDSCISKPKLDDTGLDFGLLASGPPSGSLRYAASRPSYYRPVPPRPTVQFTIWKFRISDAGF